MRFSEFLFGLLVCFRLLPLRQYSARRVPLGHRRVVVAMVGAVSRSLSRHSPSCNPIDLGTWRWSNGQAAVRLSEAAAGLRAGHRHRTRARRGARLVGAAPIEARTKPMLRIPPAARPTLASARPEAGCGIGHDGEDRRDGATIDQIPIASS